MRALKIQLSLIILDQINQFAIGNEIPLGMKLV